MSSNGWDTAAVVSDALSAHALIERLALEGVSARLQADTALLGVVRQCRILVPRESLRRAKYVLAQASFTDEELASLATGSGEERASGVIP